MTVQTEVKELNAKKIQTALCAEIYTEIKQHFHYNVRLLGRDMQSRLTHSGSNHHALCVTVYEKLLFLTTISWLSQVNITEVFLMCSFCLVSSIKHITNFFILPMPKEISTYSSQPDWLHQADLKEYLQLILFLSF